jgi:hypothetical protein
MDGAVAIAVVDHTGAAPDVVYLEQPVAVSAELLEMAQPLQPTELFRFAAPCQTGACAHWDGDRCQLAARIVQRIPAAALSLPRCHIRTRCRWYAQEGRAACGRCPRVVTQNEAPSATMRAAAMPE